MSLSQVYWIKLILMQTKSHLRCKELKYQEWLFGLSIELEMDHLLASRVLVKIYANQLPMMPTTSSNQWLFLLSEIELRICLSMIFLKIEVNLEMVLKKKCKNWSTDGAFGLRPVKFKMWRFLQEAYLLIFKQNSERKVEWMLRRFLLILKTQFPKKN